MRVVHKIRKFKRVKFEYFENMIILEILIIIMINYNKTKFY